MFQSSLFANSNLFLHSHEPLSSRIAMRYQPTLSYLQLRIESPHPYKKRKRNPSNNALDDIMSQTTNQYLMPPSAPARKRSQRFVQRDVDEFLSSDLEVSFASTVSLNSPPKEHVPLTPDRDYAEPMDISPAPPPKPSFADSEARKSVSRPRAYTSSARLFGNDLSNNAPDLLPSPRIAPAPSIKLVASNSSTQSSGKRIQRSALPTEWLLSARAPENKPEVRNIQVVMSSDQLTRTSCSQHRCLPPLQTMQWTLIRPTPWLRKWSPRYPSLQCLTRPIRRHQPSTPCFTIQCHLAVHSSLRQHIIRRNVVLSRQMQRVALSPNLHPHQVSHPRHPRPRLIVWGMGSQYYRVSELLRYSLSVLADLLSPLRSNLPMHLKRPQL